MEVVHAKILRKMLGEDEKITSKSKVDLLAVLPAALLWIRASSMWTTYRIALYKRADAPTLWELEPVNTIS